MVKHYTLSEDYFPRDKITGDLACINPVCLDILWRRGFRDVNAITEFLRPKLSSFVQGGLLLDMDKAVELLADAQKKDKHVVIYQDYDADGCCACAISVECLRELGIRTDYYCNDRSIDGFGLCINGVNNILAKYPDVDIIMTVDNGIVAVDAVEYANSKGLCVIITDHHEPGDVLPPAAAVINAKRHDETYPYRDYCGAGVAMKLMIALYRQIGRSIEPVLKTADIAALATVADVVPLLGENRALVQEGLRLIANNTRPAFAAMNRVMQPKVISAQSTLSFTYAPMVNALSRMGEDTGLAVELLLCRDDDEAGEMVLQLKALNEERKELTDTQRQTAMSMVDPGNLPPAIVLYDETFSEGLVGIIAGRLKEEFGRPVVVFADSAAGELKGSCRSTDDVNIKSVLDSIADHILRHGGHAKAAGLSIDKTKLSDFTEALCDAVRPLITDTTPPEAIDAVVDAEQLTPEFITELRILEPYGEGFREPLFGLNATCDSVRYIGEDGQHVKLTDRAHNLSVIKWNGGDEYKAKSKLPSKFVGHPSLNEWQGKVSVQFIMD